MSSAVRITRQDYERVWNHLFRGTGNEEAAFLLAGSAEADGDVELLVQEVIPVPPGGFLSQGPAHLDIDPDFMSPIIKRCRLEGRSLIDVHSHPGAGPVGFSGVDDHGDGRLLPKIQYRVPGRHHASMVMNAVHLDARIWKANARRPERIDRVVIVGQPLEVIALTPYSGRDVDLSLYDRQIRVFGVAGQQNIGETTIAVVGCGGLGALVAQHLVHHGAGKLILVDRDDIEESNRPRVVGSRPSDVPAAMPKVEIARRAANDANPQVAVTALRASVLDEAVLAQLLAAEIVVCCTDTLESRAALNRFAFQHLRPLVDCGTDVRVTGTGRAKVLGRVMVVTPDGPCLSCVGVLDRNAMDAEESGNARPPAPALMAWNGVVASFAALEVLNLLTGVKDPACQGTWTEYQGHKGITQLRPMTTERECAECRAIRATGTLR